MKKSLISAIKKLLAKLGAEEVEGNNLVEVIDSGADAIANAGGGSEPFVVTFSGTTENDNALCDKTWEEIYNAYTTGNTIICCWTLSGLGMDKIYAMPQFRYDDRANDWISMKCSAFYNVVDVWNGTKNIFQSPQMFSAFISATTIEVHAGRISAS